jgi:uncharacterized protein (TIGR00270 family)
MDCEMCGKVATAKAKIEGVDMAVCGSCARYGTAVRQLPQQSKPTRPAVRSEPLPREEIVETVRPDTPKILRRHRESLKLNQEQFAAKLQIRASTYNHYESGTSLPDITMARKIEHVIKTPLVVHMKMGAAPAKAEEGEARGLQLGDFLKKKR